MLRSSKPTVPDLIAVPLLKGKPLNIAQVELQDLHLVVGNISWEPSADFAQDVVLDEFPKPGRQVNPGTAIDLMLSEAVGKSHPSQPRQAQQPTAQQSFPDFAGTWQMFENTYNGLSNKVSAERPLTITQTGSTVHVGRDLNITDTGTITYQTYAAHDDKYGHDVAAAGQADLVDTFTWRLDGSILVFETIFDYKHQYYSHPPGKDVRIMKYRRVNPSAALSQAGPAPSQPGQVTDPANDLGKFVGRWADANDSSWHLEIQQQGSRLVFSPGSTVGTPGGEFALNGIVASWTAQYKAYQLCAPTYQHSGYDYQAAASVSIKLVVKAATLYYERHDNWGAPCDGHPVAEQDSRTLTKQ